MLTVHPEHANAKPVMMRMVKTVLNSFINPALLQFQINLVVISDLRRNAAAARKLWGCSKDDDWCHGGSSVRKKGISKSFTLTVGVYSARSTMLSTIPIDLSAIDKKNVDREILRASIIAELDAINLYEQMASMTKSEAIKANLLDVAKEEKTHVGEFQALLLQIDSEQADELEHGKREVEELAEK